MLQPAIRGKSAFNNTQDHKQVVSSSQKFLAIHETLKALVSVSGNPLVFAGTAGTEGTEKVT
jgi:hypothetical protein